MFQDHQSQTPYLLRSHKAVQFNPESDYWLDVQAFSDYLADGNLESLSLLENRAGYCERLEAVVDLYRAISWQDWYSTAA
jgi:hypothetical protein